MQKRTGPLTSLILLGIAVLWPVDGLAFRLTSPASGAQVEAGSTVTARLDPEGAGVLIGVLFSSSGRGASIEDPANNSEVDVLPPYIWTFQVPHEYVGPLTITAIGRVLGQKTGVAPQAEVTVQVIMPANVTLTAIRVRDDQRILAMDVGAKRKVYVYGQFSDGVERLVSSTTTGTRYEVADPSIAVVDGEGLVTVLAAGTTRITITNGEKRLQIEVRPAPAL